MKDPRWLRWSLLALALGFLVLFVGLPIATVFVEAFRKGTTAYLEAIRDPETLSAVKLTLLTAAIDHAHVKPDTMIAGAREIAFFPPMTGG